MIERLIRVWLSLTHFSRYKVKKEPLEAWISREFTSSETSDDLILRAHGFIFLLLGGHMLPDFSGSLVHVRYLNLLEDLESISTYSCCSCILGFLYKHLCMASLGDARQIGGTLVILQIWVWLRIPLLRPQLFRYVEQDPPALLGAMWCTTFDCSQLPTHVLLKYIDQLDFMLFDQVWL
ncbi:hypothetical protein M9H77_12314 [Catharanthus roseus]|uniref:Uncharacterized protein n=1 Tax=Catharanthus roseus TaxID=4058 RepID=A0ACC0BH32_CATRO|nr:hypothetical protein M9H77_12314 [Catharanthus roseus]